MSKSKTAPGALEKAFNVFYWGQQGCFALLINLFLCGFLGWGLYEMVIALQLERNGEIVAGSVVALDEHTQDGVTYAPVVEYRVAGRTYSFTSSSYSYPAEYSVGEQVSVRYDRDDPDTARLNTSWAERWLFPVILVAIMLGLLIGGNLWIIARWRRGEDIDLE
jgi:hypothetical protein